MKKGLFFQRNGFSLIEIIVAVSVLLTVLGGSIAIGTRYNKASTVYFEALKIRASLNEQYSKAIEGTALGEDLPFKFGICFEDDRYNLFASTSVWSERDNRFTQMITLPPHLEFKNFNFLNECQGRERSCVIFFPITGAVEAGGSVVLSDTETAEEYLINVSQGGLVEISKQ